ncbi:glycosyltransferase [Rhodobacteraceae bacterium F11138]|nr:glycosyltransferase [Rhodobacteraceae bacterium F11138]
MSEPQDTGSRGGFPIIAAVVIGRNEGDRLIACLNSLQGRFSHVVYVDSGSTDGSQNAARARAAEVVALDVSQPFTAARARNAGLDHLMSMTPPPDLVQFLDGDCILQPEWLGRARDFLQAHPDVAVVCGRRRERRPEASVWNRMIDAEWNTPTGEARACGGDALMRCDALQQVAGYNPDLIAGEEPELCLRMRMKGWRIWRIDAEMTLHDAAMTRFGQWWQRSRRAGYTYAEGAAMYGATPERHKVRELASALAWGLGLPVLLVLAAVFTTPWALLGALVYPLQILRLHRRGLPPTQAIFLLLGKFPETQGALTYAWRRLTRKQRRLIEYK